MRLSSKSVCVLGTARPDSHTKGWKERELEEKLEEGGGSEEGKRMGRKGGRKNFKQGREERGREAFCYYVGKNLVVIIMRKGKKRGR